MSERKVLFIDTAHTVLKEELTALGFICESFDYFKKDDFCRVIGDYFGVVIRSKIKLDKEILSLAHQLKFIARVGAGMESIDSAYAAQLGIVCLNSPEGNRDAVGEQAIGMLLALMNNLLRADLQVRNGQWIREGNRGYEIKGKTVGIIGYGNMGKAFAQRLKGFEANVLAYDKYKTGYSDNFVSESTMEKLFEDADIISLHVPLTEETTYLVNREYLSKFKKPIFLVNTARGKVVQSEALVEALQNGKVRGAALDVLEYEKISFENLDMDQLPEPFQYLIQSNQVVLSPHIAGWTFESHYKLAKVLVDKIQSLFC
jgi:D-3-phosphoglycerate dehydrogenase